MSIKQPKARKPGNAQNDQMVMNEVSRFIQTCAYSEKEDGEFLARLIVRHLVKGNQVGQDVASFKVPKGMTDDAAQNLARDIVTRLLMEADALGGFQKWAIYAYTNVDSINHISRFLVKLQGDPVSDDFNGDDLDTEGAGERGRSSQQMRHNEAFARTLVASTGSVSGAYNNIINRQAQMLDTMMESYTEMITGLRDMALDRHTKEMEARKLELDAQARSEGFKKLAPLVPVIINKLAGKELIPVEQAGMLMHARSLFGSITGNEEKMSKIAQILSTEEMASFLTLYDSINKATVDGDDEKSSNGAS